MSDEPMFRDPGEPPVLDWLDKSLIDVDPTYQRELDEGRVERILTWFSWRDFGALVVAPKPDGRFNCTDGQHRLAAARRHPKVQVVPSVIVPAHGTADEAANFVALNRDRRNISALDRFWAEIAAGDPDAETVASVAERAGLKLCRYPTDYDPGDTIAVGAIATLIGKVGADRAIAILAQLGKGKLAPVTSQHIKAAELLFTDAEFEEIEPEMFWVAVDTCRLSLDADARAFAQTHRVPVWRAIAATWFRKARKRRRAA